MAQTKKQRAKSPITRRTLVAPLNALIVGPGIGNPGTASPSNLPDPMANPAAILVDTHVLLWILSNSTRLKTLKWLKQFPDWIISPISLLEMKFLQECGRVSLDLPAILSKLRRDIRFQIDDAPFEELCLAAFDLSWTRDPFDRFLVAHSVIRSLPLGTVDANIRKNHHLIV